jgi:hypothetical protein
MHVFCEKLEKLEKLKELRRRYEQTEENIVSPHAGTAIDSCRRIFV